MSANIVIREAKKDYVCDCCGRIIRQGSEYLDKVTLNNGKCVRHERYHDECPKTHAMVRLMELITSSDENELLAIDPGTGGKYKIYGAKCYSDRYEICCKAWDGSAVLYDWVIVQHWALPDGKLLKEVC